MVEEQVMEDPLVVVPDVQFWGELLDEQQVMEDPLVVVVHVLRRRRMWFGE